MLIAVVCIREPTWKLPRHLLPRELLNKLCYLLPVEYYLATKRKELWAHMATRVDPKNSMLGESLH